ncbi:MAG: hypothetical protein ACLT98_05805 [Eggerthellaceae bacterium]
MMASRPWRTPSVSARRNALVKSGMVSEKACGRLVSGCWKTLPAAYLRMVDADEFVGELRHEAWLCPWSYRALGGKAYLRKRRQAFEPFGQVSVVVVMVVGLIPSIMRTRRHAMNERIYAAFADADEPPLERDDPSWMRKRFGWMLRPMAAGARRSAAPSGMRESA